MILNTIWFVLIAVLYIVFFVLEGFDFGASMLLPFLGKDDTERRAIINTIGPHWAGNEVWLITIGGFIPAFLLGVVFANIVRGVPIDQNMQYAGGVVNLLNWYGILGGA